MIDPTEQMIAVFYGTGIFADEDEVRAALAAVLAIAERQWQQQYGDGFAAGFRRAEHELCPRCGVELEQELAEERAERAAQAERAVQAERAARAGRGES